MMNQKKLDTGQILHESPKLNGLAKEAETLRRFSGGLQVPTESKNVSSRSQSLLSPVNVLTINDHSTCMAINKGAIKSISKGDFDV